MARQPTNLSALDADPDNPREISARSAAGLQVSLSEFGDLSGIVFNARTGQLVAGHQRVTQLRERYGNLKITRGKIRTPDGHQFAVRIVDWSQSKQRAANVAANSAAISGTFTDDLDAWLDALKQDAECTLYDDLLFDDLRTAQPPPPVHEDTVPEPPAPKDVVTQPGDLWLLGDHRLLCGDSTKADDVARLMDGAKCDSVVSDPPYGINFDTDYRRMTSGFDVERTNHPPVHGDDTPFDPTPWLGYKHVVLFGANCFCNHLPLGTWLVWDKRFANGKALLSDAELAWMKGGYGVYIFACTSQGFARPEAIEHPTQKPVAVMAWAIEKSKAVDPIFDPYGGSGTTLIAAEQLHRRCYAMEISPAYCDVAVKRWETLTGGTATRQPAPRKPARKGSRKNTA